MLLIGWGGVEKVLKINRERRKKLSENSVLGIKVVSPRPLVGTRARCDPPPLGSASVSSLIVT